MVIALGGLIRIYDAGESCPDWPTCFGTWGFDITAEEQGEWYSENPSEIDSRGSGHRYSTFQIFTEWSHRLLAGAILGPLVLANWLSLRKQEEAGAQARFASTLTVILIIWQGAIGWLTVEMDNLHWSVALHLSSALAFTMSMVWLWLCLSKIEGKLPDWIRFNSELSKKWELIVASLTVGVFFSLFSGTFVSTTPGANAGCGVDGFPDSWPQCDGNFLSGLEDIVSQSQMIHRWIVGVVFISMIYSSFRIWKDSQKDSKPFLRNWIWVATAMFAINSVIGATYILSWNLEEGFLELLSLVHLMMASLCFLVLATAWIGCKVSEDELI